MPELHVRIEGDGQDLEQLAVATRSSDPCIRKEEDGFYYLTSDHLNKLGDSAERNTRIAYILSSLNGIAKLKLNAATPLVQTTSYEVDDKGRKHHNIHPLSGTLNVRGSLAMMKISKGGKKEPIEQTNEILPPLTLALHDPNVGRVLSMFANANQSWRDLYPILEIMLSDVGGEDALVNMGWTTRAQVRLFKWTANNPNASGSSARHGTTKDAPPPKPMTEPEAWTFMRSLLRNWLASKSSSSPA